MPVCAKRYWTGRPIALTSLRRERTVIAFAAQWNEGAKGLPKPGSESRRLRERRQLSFAVDQTFPKWTKDGLSGAFLVDWVKHPERMNQRLYKCDFVIFRFGVVAALASAAAGTGRATGTLTDPHRGEYTGGARLPRVRASFDQRA